MTRHDRLETYSPSITEATLALFEGSNQPMSVASAYRRLKSGGDTEPWWTYHHQLRLMKELVNIKALERGRFTDVIGGWERQGGSIGYRLPCAVATISTTEHEPIPEALGVDEMRARFRQPTPHSAPFGETPLTSQEGEPTNA